MDTISTINQTRTLGETLRKDGKSVVLTGGCFDLLHIGHITFLEEAKRQGDILIVLLESDKRIQQLKGSSRPLHTQLQRAHMLTALKSIDYVVLLPDAISNTEYDNLVKNLQPAIIAASEGSDSLRFIKKQAEENHATVFLAPLIKNMSTSRILDVVSKEL